MNLLLDTHVLVWAIATPRRLPRRVAGTICDPENEVHVSAASTWEVAIKAALGKIDIELDELTRAIEQTGFTELPVRIRHTVGVRSLPPHHRDPFDRILVAQALAEGLTLVTRDPAVQQYSANTFWA